MERPTFESETVFPVRLNGRGYNAVAQKGDFQILRAANYGDGYRQGILGDQVTLAHGAYFNLEKPGAKEILGAFKGLWVMGNTAACGADELVFAIDEPLFIDGNAVMDPKKLEGMLGTKQVRGVVFSDDGKIRAMPRSNAKNGEYDAAGVLNSDIPILYTGNEQSPEMIAQILGEIQKIAYLDVPSRGNTRVPVFHENIQLGLMGDWVRLRGSGYSFGLRQAA